MLKNKKLWLPLLVFLGLSVLFWRGLHLDPHALPSTKIGQRLPDFHLSDLLTEQQIFTPASLKGQVVLFNVWGSWCQACSEEQATLLHLAEQGVKIYGLNYKDHPEQARSWLQQWGNPYVQIGQDPQGSTAIDLGVYGAPETFVIDKQGRIQARHVGVLTEEIWTQTLRPLMQGLEKE